MSIAVELHEKPVPPEIEVIYPVLRKYIGGDANPSNPLVVLFSRRTTGVALMSEHHKVGEESHSWVRHDNTDCWERCSITLKSED